MSIDSLTKYGSTLRLYPHSSFFNGVPQLSVVLNIYDCIVRIMIDAVIMSVRKDYRRFLDKTYFFGISKLVSIVNVIRRLCSYHYCGKY